MLGSREHGVKASLRNPMMLATVAVVDPELTTDCRRASCQHGAGRLTQLIEPYVSSRANLNGSLCWTEYDVGRSLGALTPTGRRGGP